MHERLTTNLWQRWLAHTALIGVWFLASAQMVEAIPLSASQESGAHNHSVS